MNIIMDQLLKNDEMNMGRSPSYPDNRVTFCRWPSNRATGGKYVSHKNETDDIDLYFININQVFFCKVAND